MSNHDGTFRDEIRLAEHGLRTSRHTVGVKNIIKRTKPTAVMPKSLRESYDHETIQKVPSLLLPEIKPTRKREEFKSSVFQTKNILL
jgi:hypothetical protein